MQPAENYLRLILVPFAGITERRYSTKSGDGVTDHEIYGRDKVFIRTPSGDINILIINGTDIVQSASCAITRTPVTGVGWRFFITRYDKTRSAIIAMQLLHNSGTGVV
ncbi:MAG: hypothetical protein ACSLEM_06910 [Candidatus Malihini olakiniferum]